MAAGPRSQQVPRSGDPLWHLGSTDDAFNGRRGTREYPPVGGGQGVWKRGPEEGVCKWGVRGAVVGVCEGSGQGREDGVFGLYGLAGRGSREEGPVRRQLQDAEKALATRKCKDGDDNGLCPGPAARRPTDVLGYSKWVQALLSPPLDAGHVRVPVRGQVLPMLRTTIRVGALLCCGSRNCCAPWCST